jgi:N4-gp56 family major capsid protein
MTKIGLIGGMNLQMFTLNNFIPQVWSAQLLVSLKKALVYGQAGIVNRDYQGEITAYGDTVKINDIGAVTIGDYTKNTNISDPEALTDATRTLQITQSKFFNFQVDDIDRAQQNPKVMAQAMVEAAYALRDVADQFIASMHTGVAAANTIGDDTTPIVPTKADAYEYLVDLSVKLDEANVPEQGRFVVVPPWFEGLMLKDDRFVKSGTTSGVETLMNGQIGAAAGFNVLKSNNVPNTTGTKYKIIAGYNGAISYAEQVNQVEGYRPEKRFADAVKGLHLYGAKLVRPTGIAVLTANKS